MTFNFNINLNCPQLVQGFELLRMEIMKGNEAMGLALERIKEEVSELKTVNLSVKQLLTSFAQEIRDHIGDEEALNQLADDIDAENQSVTAAVLENTPQA